MSGLERLFIPSKSIVIADADDLQFILHLQRKHSNALGFLPTPAIDWYINNSRVLLGRENDTEAGYLLGRTHLRWNHGIRPITQAAVAMDAMRRHLGLAMLQRTETAAREAGQLALQASCREGLDANEFWKAAGFEEICRLQPHNARRKLMIVWRKQITPVRPDWFNVPPPVAGWKAKRTTAIEHS